MNTTAADLQLIADNRFRHEAGVRADLAAALTDPDRPATYYDAASLLKATADAQPWHNLVRLAKSKGMDYAVTALREHYTRNLLERDETRSTSAFANEADRLDREAQRRFLADTEFFAPEEQPEQKATAEEVEPTVPAEQPTEKTDTPRPTPAQIKALDTIANASATVRQTRPGSPMAITTSPGRAKIRWDVMQRLQELGWAHRDNSTSLYRGQRMLITPAGRTALNNA
ncbi:hypothetical protein RM572_00540 [Streptomyces sp. DSM 42041]|uniref:Uncharacterized protein n=1 Tax=Streptomyces hazeniae TaxID=3075538 RepID=A0ABU2NK17_9ACTN|nr:hypothetical protein [Streptomyces sp. DSM 42041]MDT0377263.1 hypothetical protein [Streptomyces sp. DSM 42041]